MNYMGNVDYDNLNPELREAILSSRSMLELKDDFDGYGFQHIEEATWKRAIDFLLHYYEHFRKEGKSMFVPDIDPGPHGGVDLFWRNIIKDGEKRELLLHVPPDPNEKASFYGSDFSKPPKYEIKGKTNPPAYHPDLLAWLEKIERS